MSQHNKFKNIFWVFVTLTVHLPLGRGRGKFCSWWKSLVAAWRQCKSCRIAWVPDTERDSTVCSGASGKTGRPPGWTPDPAATTWRAAACGIETETTHETRVKIDGPFVSTAHYQLVLRLFIQSVFLFLMHLLFFPFVLLLFTDARKQ
jgi:hypothetical protein